VNKGRGIVKVRDQTDQESNDTEPHVQRFSLLSHDILSALSEVVGGVRMLDASKVDDDARIQLERITASGEALARLLEGVLSEDKISVAGTSGSARNVNLSDFLEDTQHRWIGLAREKGIEFVVDKSSKLPAIITVDRMSLDRIIANLVNNAIKYTDAGTVTLTVYYNDQNDLCFDVIDQGRGFSDSAFERLFEFKGRPTDTTKPGIGMGLFIAKDLSNRIGGDVTAKNLPDGGAAVSLQIPHKSWFDRSLIRIHSSDPVPDLALPDLSHLKILLAEDNTTNQMVASQMLQAMNAEIRVASDGVEALEFLKHQQFDVVLLDIEMPRMSGLELINNVRGMRGKQAQMTLIALTAYVMRKHRERIYQAGADGIIAKPLMRIEDLGRGILEYHNRNIPELALERAALLSEVDTSKQEDRETVVDRIIFDNLVEIIGPDSALELLGKLQADTDSVAQGINLGRRTLNLAELRTQTHILISVAGAIGATNLQTIAQRLNGAANRQDANDIDQLCRDCLSGLADLQAFIRVEQDKTVAGEPVRI